MTKVMMLGDTHGNTRHAVSAVRQAAKLGVSKILQLGDFGLWDHDISGVRFLDTLNEELRKHGISLYFIRGNHENHDHLDLYEKIYPRDRAGQLGNIYIRSHILYWPDGNIVIIGGKRFLGVGGAASIDKDWRLNAEAAANRPRSLWWPQEQLSQEDADKLIYRAGKVDYMFSHEGTNGIPMPLLDHLESTIHRQRFSEVVKAYRPDVLFHGHYHKRLLYGYGHTTVVGADCDGTSNSYYILDVESGQIDDVHGNKVA